MQRVETSTLTATTQILHERFNVLFYHLYVRLPGDPSYLFFMHFKLNCRQQGTSSQVL